MRMPRLAVAFALAGLLIHSPALAKIAGAKVERGAAGVLSLTWSSPDPVDIYEGAGPRISPKTAHRLVQASTSGQQRIDPSDAPRRYFLLVDRRDHQAIEVAERLVPLEQGSNFRDVGGYVGAGGKHVRWGLIYRSGGQPLLTPADVARVRAMGLVQVVDLRSSEERVIAPTKITGVPYAAVGYSMGELMASQPGAQMRNGADVYRNMPRLLAPHLRIIFRSLLSGQAPLVYNCSAGQDRTGFTTAVILSALGVSQDQIVADYHLSTGFRRPEFEMPELDAASHPNDPAVQMFAAARKTPAWKTPTPLKDADGRPFLRGALEAIDAKWGSMDAYLAKEIGLTPADRVKLKRLYLE